MISQNLICFIDLAIILDYHLAKSQESSVSIQFARLSESHVCVMHHF